jgi:hypothetical protein
MNKHLGIAIDPLVELLVRDGRILDADLMADDEAGFGFAGDDQVALVAVVGFDVALAGSEEETLERGGG